MNAPVIFSEWPAPREPALPEPKLERWQPLRLGLVELYHYDSEEFWFRDGHLLLRGNNGTGKSKVLSLTLPFLLDAQIKPSRIERNTSRIELAICSAIGMSRPICVMSCWMPTSSISESLNVLSSTPAAASRFCADSSASASRSSTNPLAARSRASAAS